MAGAATAANCFPCQRVGIPWLMLRRFAAHQQTTLLSTVPLPTRTDGAAAGVSVSNQITPSPARRPAGSRPDRSMSLMPLLLRPAARFLAAFVAGRPVEAVATVLHRAGALPRNRALERLVRDDSGADDWIASLLVGVMRCLC
uniref:Uncharacterized protein n=1 Tax=Avena sativa TaxID=4498 RepID=A0ACD5ZCX6_AVESA